MALTSEDIASVDEVQLRGLEAARELAAFAGIERRARVMEIGCGIGGPARTLASELGCDVVRTGLVEASCRMAELLTQPVGLADDVTVRQGNAFDRPFGDGTWDVI